MNETTSTAATAAIPAAAGDGPLPARLRAILAVVLIAAESW